jgi:hypothetical protein
VTNNLIGQPFLTNNRDHYEGSLLGPWKNLSICNYLVKMVAK